MRKILFPQPVKIVGRKLYPPDYRLAALCETENDFIVMTDWDKAKKQHKKVVFRIKKTEDGKIMAIAQYGITLANEIIEKFINKTAAQI